MNLINVKLVTYSNGAVVGYPVRLLLSEPFSCTMFPATADTDETCTTPPRPQHAPSRRYSVAIKTSTSLFIDLGMHGIEAKIK